MKHQKELLTEYQQIRSEDTVEMLDVVYMGFKKTILF